MSDEKNTTDNGGGACFEGFSATKLFKSFRSAVQPGKLLLGLAGLVVICAAGVILDMFTPGSVMSVEQADADRLVSEIDMFAAEGAENVRDNYTFNLDQWQTTNNNKIILGQSSLKLSKEQIVEKINNGEILSYIEDKREDMLDDVTEVLADYYEQCVGEVKKINADEPEILEANIEILDTAYLNLFNVLTDTDYIADPGLPGFKELAKMAPKADKGAKEAEKQIDNGLKLAKVYQAAKCNDGKGIFASFLRFKVGRMHNAVAAMLSGDCASAKQQAKELVLGGIWLMRFHPVFAIILCLVGLAVWSIVGGAICRMTALQIARDERIGALEALRFSLDKFSSFLSAPLIPLAFIILIGVLMSLFSLIVAIPVVGEVIGGILLPLALAGGFILALMIVGLIGGFNLMFPTIAVEGSDSFDALSRSFSYIFARPWRMGLYSLATLVYGAICYMFVRLFVFLLLFTVHCSVKATANIDGSSMISIRGKLDAIWPMPSFTDLQPAVNWTGLGFFESVGAGLIWIWVGLAVAMIAAFVISFYFSANTIIYLLLRKKVDATDIDEVYVAKDAEELIAEQAEEVKPAEIDEEKAPPADDADDATEPEAEQPDEPSDNN